MLTGVLLWTIYVRLQLFQRIPDTLNKKHNT